MTDEERSALENKLFFAKCEYIGRTGGVAKENVTVHDYFAGQAIAGIMSNSTLSQGSIDGCVRCAYEIADAMLAMRGRKKTP